MPTMMVTQQANSLQLVRGAIWLRDFKRFDMRLFTNFKKDPTEPHMWISIMEIIFVTMDCPKSYKVSHMSYMLQKVIEVWWIDNKKSINLGGGVMTWDKFKETFLKRYYPKVARVKKQQEFTHLTQGGRQ